MNKQFKRAKETINILNTHINDNEELIAKINKYIRIAKDNYDYQSVIRLKDDKRELKAITRELKQSKKEIMLTVADCVEMDKSTVNAESNKPLTREILMANYRVTDTFKDVTLNSINEDLPFKLSSNTLSKIIREVFPDVQERKCTNDIKYNMEVIL